MSDHVKHLGELVARNFTVTSRRGPMNPNDGADANGRS
jgi:hypothetical protein